MRRTLMLTLLLATTMSLLAISGASARPSARPASCGLDRAWLTSTVEGSLYELTGAKIALERSASPQVRQLAATIARDHAKFLTESGRFLRKLGFKAPGTMDAVEHWSLHMVSHESGAGFDHDYAWLEVANHVVDIRAARNETQNGCDPTVRSMARDELPYLRLHLRLASSAQAASPKTHG